MSPFSTVRRNPVTATPVDLEAQSFSLPLPPLVAHTRPDPSPPTTDPIDDFFGVARPQSQSSNPTHDSRHDSLSLSMSGADAPPSYASTYSELPAYQEQPQEPVTLAMYLFKFGFLFPPFWLLGAFIIFSPLHPPPPSEFDLSPAKSGNFVRNVRTAEVRWARRCAWALLGLTVVVAVVVVIAVLVLRIERN